MPERPSTTGYDNMADYMAACVPIVLKDGSAKDQAQAVAICQSKWNEKKGEKEAEIESTRLYGWLEVREVNEEKRIITGVATTPVQARDGDVLVTEGIKFKLPIPFLWRHKDPFGNVINARVSPNGIEVEIQAAPAGTSRATDEYWNLIKAKVVRGLSIGWRTLQEE